MIGLLGLLANVVAAPVVLPTKGLLFVLEKIKEQVQGELLDEGKIRQYLLELQALLDHGLIGEDEFTQAEDALLDRLDAIIAFKEEQAEE
ncbi:MAG: gas vesicle protein GvpG [Anaerolineae bacterium]